jgi:hypothetical protein
MAYCPQILYNSRWGQFCFQGSQRGNPLLINILGEQKLRSNEKDIFMMEKPSI